MADDPDGRVLPGLPAVGEACEHEMAEAFLGFSVCALGISHHLHPACFPVQSSESWH
uniref:Uncharacterized protein n=1 Tax=Arundo donax TaxID=35708 RepID=A0A0A9E039_ARUDO